MEDERLSLGPQAWVRHTEGELKGQAEGRESCKRAGPEGG